MNLLVAEPAEQELSALGFCAFRHPRVPPDDGRSSLGQLAIAAKRLAKKTDFSPEDLMTQSTPQTMQAAAIDQNNFSKLLSGLNRKHRHRRALRNRRRRLSNGRHHHRRRRIGP